MKSILIAGGYGLIGRSIARQIRTEYRDIELILAGRNPERGRELAEQLGNARTARLDIDDLGSLDAIGHVDLIIAALKDPTDSLINAASAMRIAHIGITKLADDIAPVTASALRNPPHKPIVLLGHWQAGVMTAAAVKASESFSRIKSIKLAALYDPQDPIGPMTAEDSSGFLGRALLREEGAWKWVDARQHARTIRLSDGTDCTGFPLGVLDVPSLAAATHAPDIRFDLMQGDSIGTRAGGQASHDIYVDIEGVLTTGEPVQRRIIVTDPKGQAHLTALGVFVAVEGVLGLGQPPAAGGIQLPELLVSADTAMTRFQQSGVQITTAIEEQLD
ncbi:hypothetical protein DNH61_10385 [Paenibacillus sambharensis]|uniref:Saccharopine dehydrogenase n=1 Tax=Paenibacillus sambharensis TaxID=1803190 RepID=A0A2W1LAV2_9BACL|nr:hypothetical protein [Paenibacillus sambharensis]PZD95849.1 hypothetical protein DNH61_10385 [Paenibacillus sambharensis]